MSALLDVSFLVACGWQSHDSHLEARKWLEAQTSFTTCPLTQLGFLRVSLSPAFRASWDDAQTDLQDLVKLRQARFIPADLDTKALPSLGTGQDVTDAYFVSLAKAYQLKFVTLDDALCKKSWAMKIAFNPLARRVS